jgi:hypothetical protein
MTPQDSACASSTERNTPSAPLMAPTTTPSPTFRPRISPATLGSHLVGTYDGTPLGSLSQRRLHRFPNGYHRSRCHCCRLGHWTTRERNGPCLCRGPSMKRRSIRRRSVLIESRHTTTRRPDPERRHPRCRSAATAPNSPSRTRAARSRKPLPWTGPFTAVAGATSPYQPSTTAGAKFYRASQ